MEEPPNVMKELATIKKLIAIGVGLLGVQIGLRVFEGLIMFLTFCATM